MKPIKYHKARTPDEEDIWQVKVGGLTCVGSIYFSQWDSDDCFIVVGRNKKNNTEKAWGENDYLVDAAKTLIREKDACMVCDEEGYVVAELQIGKKYRDDETN